LVVICNSSIHSLPKADAGNNKAKAKEITKIAFFKVE